MRSLILDGNAISFAKGLNLVGSLEGLIQVLPDKAYVERSVYVEMVRSGLGQLLNDWQKGGLLQDPVDYRRVPDGDSTYRRFSGRKWRGLSRQDRASLAIARAYSPSGLLSCDDLLGRAATDIGVFPVDLLDVIRFGIKFGKMTEPQAREICSLWDKDEFRAGRPIGYRGSFDAERDFRAQAKPLPL